MLSREAKNYYRLKEREIRKKKELEKFKLIRDAHRAACKYNPGDLICSQHHIKFIKYEYVGDPNSYCYSYGCPVCVGLIRAKVQMEINRSHFKSVDGKKRAIKYRRPNAKTKRGRPKTKTIATVVEARDGI